MSMPSHAPARAALAETLLPEGALRFLTALLLVLAGTVILAVSAKIRVPFFPVPITLQTLAVMAIAAGYGARLAVITVLVYFAQGALGMPVFTNTPPAFAGPAYFLGPTGGFLLGFVVIAVVVGRAADRGWSRSFPRMLATMFVADAITMLLGFAWLAWFLATPGGSGLGVAAAWSAGVAPFIPGELLKVVLAAAAVPAVWRLVERR